MPPKVFYLFLLLTLGPLSTKADSRLDSLKQIGESTEDDSVRCSVYLRIAYILYKGESSIEYANKALVLAKEIGNQQQIGDAFHRLAWCHDYVDMDKKTAFLDSAESVFTSVNDEFGLGKTFDTKGVILMTYGAFEDAATAFEKGFDYYVLVDDQELQAGILNNWGVCLYMWEKPKAATDKFQAALDFRLQEKPKKPIEIGRLYHGLGECSKLEGKLKEATKFYLESLKYRAKVRGNLAIAEPLISIANMTFEAIENGVDTSGIDQLLNEVGIPDALAALDSAANVPGISKSIGFQEVILDARRKWYLLQGDYQQAYQTLLELKTIDEEGKLNESSLAAMADLQLKYEKERLNSQLLEEEIINRKKEKQVNLLLLSLGILLSTLVIGTLVYQNRLKAKSLLLATAKQEKQIISMRSMLEGQEKERARIARDLHDGLGNLLSTLKANVGSLQVNFDNQNSQHIYGTASDMIDEACTEVRKIAHEMMPQSLSKLGFIKAVEDLIFKTDNVHDFDVDFQIFGTEQILDDNTNVMLYRIVQELFNNIIKYANAKEVLLQITFSEDWFNLTVEDDGIGFNLDKIPADERMGLRSIAFRTEYIGGNYEIDSRPGNGTLVSINVPLITSS